ncbi:MAG: hypothetical protein ABUT20_43130, partial [Bacteroidota bacterium]
NINQRYSDLQAGLLQSNSGALKNSAGQYIPSLDSLKNTLLFLQNNKNLLANTSSINGGQLSAAIAKVQGLQDRINAADNIKTYLAQRKQYLSEQLGRFGMVKDLQQMNQSVYYYKQQLSDFKTSVNDPSKVKQKAVDVLSQLPAYKNFIRQNSYLASIFGQPENYNLSDSGLQGLQTRAAVQKMVQDKIGTGGPGAEQRVAQQVQMDIGAFTQLKNKLTQLGGTQDPEDFGFKPNTQKTHTLWKRIEYGANLQFEPSNNLLPVICDLALSLGYRLNDNGTIGVGMAYKMGLGDGIEKIQFSNQGLGLRSYIDWKLKKSLYLSGGYERNYLSGFQSLSQLGVSSSWQNSGLIGLSRKYRISSKLNGKVQILFDFLSYSQIPKSQPFVFRAGWAL